MPRLSKKPCNHFTFQGGNGGRIVNIASLAAFDNYMSPFKNGNYHMSKSGVVGYTRHFGDCTPADNPWKMEGVKSMAICPWFVETDMVKDPKLPNVPLEIKKTTYNIVDLNSKSNVLRYLQCHEVADVFMTALDLDDNGAAFTVVPGIPTIKLPNVNLMVMAASAMFGKLGVLFNPKIRQINGGIVVALLSFLFVGTNFMLGMLFRTLML